MGRSSMPKQMMKEGGMAKKKEDKSLTEREKALKKAKDRSNKEKANKETKKKATGDAVYKKYVNQYQREKDRTGVNKKADTFFDKVGDKVRGSAVGKYAKSKGTGTFSRDDEAQMQARKDIKGYNNGGMANMNKKDVPKVPTKEEFDAMTPKQQGERKRAAMMQNLNLSPKEKAAKKAMENKKMEGMKKMNMGGMTAPMMGDPKSKKPMMPPKRKPAPRPAPTTDPRMKDPREKGSAMPMMKKGGKVRGAGMAKKGVRACKMR